MTGFIDRSNWKDFLDEFSKRNQLRATRLEVVGDFGAQEEEVSLPFVGVSFETRAGAAGAIEILLGGETAQEERHLERRIPGVERIAPLVGLTGFEDGLAFEDQDGGKTLLLFKHLPEIAERTSDSSDNAEGIRQI